MSVIDMQTIRYINLLDRITRVKTMKCFVYNNIIVFAVPRALVSKAIGAGAANIRLIQEQLGKRVRIVEEPEGIEDATKFIGDVVSPLRFKSLELRDGMFILTAGSMSKAALIGRNKKRLEELQQIVKDNFNVDLKIV
jgi:transcription antitermination factor NusA-like protein